MTYKLNIFSASRKATAVEPFFAAEMFVKNLSSRGALPHFTHHADPRQQCGGEKNLVGSRILGGWWFQNAPNIGGWWYANLDFVETFNGNHEAVEVWKYIYTHMCKSPNLENLKKYAKTFFNHIIYI